MGDKTGISWTDATWNPIRGCSRVSEGCRHCYAERVAARFSKPGQAYEGLATLRRAKRITGPTGELTTPVPSRSSWTGEVRLFPEHLADPLKWRKPRRIFVNSMSDLFHEKLTNEQIAAVFGVMAACPQHTFQVLTKRARRMREWFEWAAEPSALAKCHADWNYAALRCARAAFDALEWEERLAKDPIKSWPLPNVWLGVSVENQEAADERISELIRVPAVAHFLSCEPLLGAVDLAAVRAENISSFNTAWLDWIIAGCESGPGARPCDVEWLRSLRDQCAAAGVAFFLKQAVETPECCEECGETIRRQVTAKNDELAWCGCTVEGPEACSPVGVGWGDGSKRKPGGVIELPYLDGAQHAAFPRTA